MYLLLLVLLLCFICASYVCPVFCPWAISIMPSSSSLGQSIIISSSSRFMSICSIFSPLGSGINAFGSQFLSSPNTETGHWKWIASSLLSALRLIRFSSHGTVLQLTSLSVSLFPPHESERKERETFAGDKEFASHVKTGASVPLLFLLLGLDWRLAIHFGSRIIYDLPSIVNQIAFHITKQYRLTCLRGRNIHSWAKLFNDICFRVYVSCVLLHNTYTHLNSITRLWVQVVHLNPDSSGFNFHWNR